MQYPAPAGGVEKKRPCVTAAQKKKWRSYDKQASLPPVTLVLRILRYAIMSTAELCFLIVV